MKNNKGSVSIFLCIALMAVILLTLVLVDASRISSGKVQVERAVRSAATSSLACYSSRLKNQFGIFSLSQMQTPMLKENIQKCILENLKSNGVYDFRIERLKIVPVYNLTDNEVTKSQILKYMKYRAPKEFIEKLWEKISQARSAPVMAEALELKTKVDLELSGMDVIQKQLKEALDGSSSKDEDSTGDTFVNGFNSGISSRSVLINSFISLYSSSLEGKENKDNTDRQKSQEQLKLLWNTIKIQMTQKYIDPNLSAIQNIKAISEAGSKAATALELLNSFKAEHSGEMTSEFNNSLTQDINGLSNILLKNQETQSMLDKVAQNVSILSNIVTNMEQLEESLFERDNFNLSGDENNYGESTGGSKSGFDLKRVISALTEGVENYNNIAFNYATNADETVIEGNDRRETGKNEVIQLFTFSKLLGRNFESSGIIADMLPSKYKVIDHQNIFDKNVMDDIVNKVDFKDRKASFSTDAFNFVGSMGKYLNAAKEEIMDTLYVNEYIMGCFKNSVNALEVQNKKIVDKDLRGKEKALRKTFFDNEVEYILNGASADNVNKAMCISQLLLVRFAMDTIHVYTDTQKKQAANAMATAIAGWWTAGAGIPLISNLIMCAWGMGEAVIDVKELMEGKSIPFYKLKGDWKLQIGIDTGACSKSNEALCFNYYDYLRLFLLLINEDKKLGRLEDLIQLDMQQTEKGFTAAESYVGLQIEAELSMNYLFINSAIMPEKLKTADGRHSYKVVVYEGY